MLLFIREKGEFGARGGAGCGEEAARGGGVCFIFQLLRFQEKEGESVCECVCVFLNLEAGRKTDESF